MHFDDCTYGRHALDTVTRDPGDYQGRHQLDPLTKTHQLWFGTPENGCSICRSALHSS